MPYIVSFFTDNRGRSPVLDFLKSLDKPTQAKALRLFDLLAIHGFSIGMPYSKKLATGLYELRSSGKNSIRIFYTFLNNHYILLHAFAKKTNKTPPKELATALSRLDLL